MSFNKRAGTTFSFQTGLWSEPPETCQHFSPSPVDYWSDTFNEGNYSNLKHVNLMRKALKLLFKMKVISVFPQFYNIYETK